MKRMRGSLTILLIIVLLTACNTDTVDVKDGTYIMQTLNENGSFLPRVTINDDEIIFSYDFLSSYVSIGTYTAEGNMLTMITDDEMYRYKFIIEGQKLYFQKDDSSEIKLTDERLGYKILDNAEFIWIEE